MADKNSEKPDEKVACESRYSRKEFLHKVLKNAAITGAIMAAPAVLDKFLVPPVYAMPSTAPGQD